MSHWVSSEIAASYRTFRPRYPEKLFEKIAQIYFSSSSESKTNNPRLILDVGCGSGQAISGLINVFPPGGVISSCRYVGLDPSEAQLKEARTEFESFKNSISFVQGDAGSAVEGELAKAVSSALQVQEKGNDSNDPVVDIVTVAQALHWIDIKNFSRQLFSSSSPLLNPETGIVAAWLYSTNRIINSKECDVILDEFDKMLLHQGFWPEGRWSIENLYEKQIVEFERNGFHLLAKEVVSDERELSLESFVNYLQTWSGVQKFEKEKKLERGVAVEEAIRKPFLEILMKSNNNNGEWKDHSKALRVRYDFHLFVFKPNKK